MKSLKDILSNKSFDQPESIKLIKDFVMKTYQSEVEVIERDDAVIIKAGDSALAHRLFMSQPKLQKLIGTSKKIIVRG